jgi:hypothetical protein
MLTRHEQERILDEQIARMVDEQEQIVRTRDLAPTDYYCESRNITGVPSAGNRNYRAAASSWDIHHAPTLRADGTTGHRAVGRVRAVGSDVKVTRPGHATEIRSATSFRRPRETTSRATVAARNEAQDRRLALLAKVGNASEYNN